MQENFSFKNTEEKMIRNANVFICVCLILISLFVFWIPSIISSSFGENKATLSSWPLRLLINLLGYATILGPGYIILRFLKKSGYNDQTVPKGLSSIVQLCFFGKEAEKIRLEEGGASIHASKHVERTISQEAWIFLICFMGLQGSYLTWGVLQEKIMTRDYVANDGSTDRFKDSQFLVFVNRILAFMLSGIYILCTSQPHHISPLYKYSYCSFTNVMSSWCQYEALKYVSFPTQVLAKASKIIPVMIMGKFVSKKSYEFYEYLTAVIMSIGMAMFLLGSAEEHRKTTVTTFSGVIILIGYMAFDSFTSNWQSELFTQYRMSSVQMMCGVNLFSCIFTLVSLIQQGSFITSFYFMLMYPKFIFDIIILSLCSALGQFFIFFTIAQFDAVVFVIIMTIRQGLAILLSCLIYQHPITSIGTAGILLVFLSIFIRVYCNQRLKALKSQKLHPSPETKT